MTTETKNFNRHIHKFMAKSGLSIDIVLKKFAFDLLARIIKKNPVDTGRSRAAWYISFEKLGNLSPDMLGMPKTSNERSYPEGVSTGRAEGSFVDHTTGHLIKYVDIINGVDYIIYLEYGHSDQAPIGMVRLSMRELRKGVLPKEITQKIRQDWKML